MITKKESRFFMPNKTKFTLFIILVIIGEFFLVPTLLFGGTGNVCMQNYCPNSFHLIYRACSECGGSPSFLESFRHYTTLIFNPFLRLILELKNPFDQFASYADNTQNFLLVFSLGQLSSFLYWHVLSCLFYFIYSRVNHGKT